MEAVRYQGTPPMITALANNELEVANLAYSTLRLAIQNAGLDDLRIIADEFQDGVPGYYSSEFFVRKDSGINKIEDLEGQGPCNERHRQRHRHRDEGGAEEARADRQARLTP